MIERSPQQCNMRESVILANSPHVRDIHVSADAVVGTPQVWCVRPSPIASSAARDWCSSSVPHVALATLSPRRPLWLKKVCIHAYACLLLLHIHCQQHHLLDILDTRVDLELLSRLLPVNVALGELVNDSEHVVDLADELRGGVALAQGDGAVLESCDKMLIMVSVWA